jgi:hypothetical protein
MVSNVSGACYWPEREFRSELRDDPLLCERPEFGFLVVRCVRGHPYLCLHVGDSKRRASGLPPPIPWLVEGLCTTWAFFVTREFDQSRRHMSNFNHQTPNQRRIF